MTTARSTPPWSIPGGLSIAGAVLLGCLLSIVDQAAAEEIFVEANPPLREDFGFGGETGSALPTRGPFGVVVVYAQFEGEASDDGHIPDFAADLIDPNTLGSLAHFYRTMSFGQLEIHGAVLPRRYTSRRPASAFVALRDDQHGRYGEFVLEILPQVDAEYDLGQFDNDGPDGQPNSGDDDGVVDYLFLILRKTPPRFIIAGATGIAELGFEGEYISEDTKPDGQPIRVVGDQRRYGSIMQGGTLAFTVGSMAHEFGHALGLPDLYDRSHLTAPAQADSAYSAGIGRWGLMGKGTLGWQVEGKADGPNPFCAWSLEQLGWIGPDNEYLVEIGRDTTQVILEDLDNEGPVVKMVLPSRALSSGMEFPRYLLLETRNRSQYYNRHQPGDGLLVWDIQTLGKTNFREELKLVDLVCADGRYAQAGFPRGRMAAPRTGGDNLDFWAPDQTYREIHGGNQGDATDLFDGSRFTELIPPTNPSSQLGLDLPAAYKTFALRRIHRRGQAMVLDIDPPGWSGVIDGQVRWAGQVRVDGDLTVAPQGRLIVHGGTQVRVGGRDRAPVKIRVEGELVVQTRGLTRYNRTARKSRERVPSTPAVFAAQTPGQTWAGLLGVDGLDLGDVVVRDVDASLARVPGPPIATAVVEEDLGQETAPEHFALLPNYPNPFADQTTLRYTLETPAQVQLVIYNTLGQPVRHLVDDYQSEGLQEVVWQCRNQDGQRVASGLYMSHLEVPGQFNQSRKMMLLAGGFARIDRLDERLQRAGADWSVLETDLAAAPEVDFGGIATPSTRQAAFTAGMLWVRLQVAGQYRPAGLRLQRHARRLTQMVELLDPVAAGLAEQLQNLRAEAATGERLGWVRRELETLVQDLGEAEAVYFYLGEWLESLRTTGLAAWRLSEPLGQVGDPAADATAARQFGVLLVAQGADPGLVEVLDQVGDALAADPRARGEVVALVGLLDSIADGLALR